jgi:hypothetical protein
MPNNFSETQPSDYNSGGVKVLCSKRIIAKGLTDVPEQKVFLSFYQSEYAYAFSMIIYGYFPDGYQPEDPAFDAELIKRDMPLNNQGEITSLSTRVISLSYPEQGSSSYTLWEIRITYCLDFSSLYNMQKAQAIQLNLIPREGKPVISGIFTIPKRFTPFFDVVTQELDVSQEIIHTGIKVAPLEPLVVFNTQQNPDGVNDVQLIIYAFIPTGYAPHAVMLIPHETSPGLVVPIEGEDPASGMDVSIRTISIRHDLAVAADDKKYGRHDMWKIHVNYKDTSAQMLRVCYSVGDPVTTRGTVTSVQRT